MKSKYQKRIRKIALEMIVLKVMRIMPIVMMSVVLMMAVLIVNFKTISVDIKTITWFIIILACWKTVVSVAFQRLYILMLRQIITRTPNGKTAIDKYIE